MFYIIMCVKLILIESYMYLRIVSLFGRGRGYLLVFLMYNAFSQGGFKALDMVIVICYW